MTTPLDIITQGLKIAGVLGVGQTPLAEDTNDAFNLMNGMMSQWQRKRWLVPYLVDTGLISTGASTYSVGPSGDFNISRPDKLEDGCYIRQLTNSSPNQVDTPVTLITSMENYTSISLKQLTSFQQYIYYQPTYPRGTIYPYPLPQASVYELHILTKASLGQFTSLAQTIILPLEYIPALEWNLAQRLRIAYRLPKDEELNAMARDSLNLIRTANTQVAVMRMPSSVTRGPLYNFFGDNIY